MVFKHLNIFSIYPDQIITNILCLGADGGFKQQSEPQQQEWGDFTSAGPSPNAAASPK
jgi:hypothetical protein